MTIDLCKYNRGISKVAFMYCETEYTNTASVSNVHKHGLLWVKYIHAHTSRVWVDSNTKHTQLRKC